MRLLRLAAAFLVIASVAVIAGCGTGASVSGLLARKGISVKDAGVLKIELRFLKESKGSNYKFEDISGNAALMGELLDCLNTSRASEKPQEEQFSPELRSDCEIVFTTGSGEAVSFFYMVQGNMLIYPERTKDKEGEILEYRYFTAGDKLSGLLQGQQQYATLKQDDAVKSFRNMEELKSSVDPDELAEAGTEIDFEFFTDSTPDNAGTACRIYTSAECAAVPQDSYLITAYGKKDTGEQVALWIQGMVANTYYTKVIVTEPDEALESVDMGDSPDSHAITVKKDAFDPSKWIVFVDAGNNVLDIILPEDIAE